MPSTTLALRTSTIAFSMFVLSLVLTGCGANSQMVVCPLSSTGSATCTCGGTGAAACPVIPGPEFLYASGGGQIAGFSIDRDTGALTQVATITGPSMSFGLTAVNNQFLYASDPINGQLDGFSIDQTTGALTALAGSPFSTGRTPSIPEGLASPAFSNLLYAADAAGVDGFTVSTTGTPTPLSGSPFPSGTNLYLVVDPSSNFLFTSIDNPQGGSVFAFTIGSTGALSAVQGSPFSVPDIRPYGIVDTGSYVYAALSATDQIAAFSVTSDTGVLTPIANSPFSTGATPNNLVLAGSFLYAIDDGEITGYSIDSSTGMLTPLSNSPFAISGVAIATDFLGQYLYVADSADIQAFSVDQTSGNLTSIAGSPFPANLGIPLVVTVAQIPPP